jgi:hypothetical protein
MHRAATGLAGRLEARTALLVNHRYGASYEEWEAGGPTLVSDPGGLELAIEAGLVPTPRDQHLGGSGDPRVDRLGLPPDPADPDDEHAIGEPLLLWHLIADPFATRPALAAQVDAFAVRARTGAKTIVPGVGAWFVRSGQLGFKPSIAFRDAVKHGGVHAPAAPLWRDGLAPLSLACDVALGSALRIGLNWKPTLYGKNPATDRLITVPAATWPFGWFAGHPW